MQKWKVELDTAAKKKIKMILRSKRVSMETKKRAQILLDADKNKGSLKTIAGKRGVSSTTILRVKRCYVESGIDGALFRKKRTTPPVEKKVTGEVEAHIIAVSCSAPPEGKSRWTMQMIADKVVLNGVIDTISDETVRLVLKKRTSATHEIAMVHSTR